MDGSTDNSQVENEQFMFLFCKRYNKLQEIKTCARYFFAYSSQERLMQMGDIPAIYEVS